MPKLTKRPDRPNYYAWITDPATGHKKRKSTRQSNQRTAGVVAERAERTAHSPYTSTTFDEAADAFMAQRASLKAEGTQQMYRQKLGTLARLLGSERDLASIDASVVDRFIATRLKEGVKKSTIGKELTALSGMLKLARRQKRYPHSLDEVMPEKWERTSVPKERWCPPEEVWAIIDELPAHRAAVIAFHVATGSNLGEAMRAQREDVSSDRSQVFLRGTKRASRRRVAPVMPWGAPFLKFALDNVPAGRGARLFRDWPGMRWDLKRICDRLKIEGVSSNDLRRTYSQWLRQRGVEPSLIAPAMGHSSSRMVEQVYGKLPVDKLRPLIDAQLEEKDR